MSGMLPSVVGVAVATVLDLLTPAYCVAANA